MKRVIILNAIILLLTYTASAQQLYLEGGKTISSFDYENSQGGTLDNLHSSTHSYMGLGLRTKMFSKKVHGSFGLGYATYGAIGSDDSVGNYMEWNVNYLELGFGLDFNAFSFGNTQFLLKAGTSLGLMVDGVQTLNNQVINLKGEDDFDQSMLNFKIGAGFSHPISNKLSLYVQYLYGKSSNQGNDGDNETLKIKSHNINFGVLINLAKANDS